MSIVDPERLGFSSIPGNWNHFSDHLPVGVRFTNGLSIVTCNVLNKKYMNWITDFPERQYLVGSVVTSLHDPTYYYDRLDGRELESYRWVVDLLIRHLRITLIALQEVSRPLWISLQKACRQAGYGYMPSGTNFQDNQEVILYDRKMVWVKKLSLNAFAIEDATKKRMKSVLCEYRQFPDVSSYRLSSSSGTSSTSDSPPSTRSPQRSIPTSWDERVSRRYHFFFLSTHLPYGKSYALDAKLEEGLITAGFPASPKARFSNANAGRAQTHAIRSGKRIRRKVRRRRVPVIACGDLNVDSRDFGRAFPFSSDAMCFTNEYYNHVNSNEPEPVLPRRFKIAKFDYVLVSSRLRHHERNALGPGRKTPDWWASHFEGIAPRALGVDGEVALLGNIYEALESQEESE